MIQLTRFLIQQIAAHRFHPGIECRDLVGVFHLKAALVNNTAFGGPVTQPTAAVRQPRIHLEFQLRNGQVSAVLPGVVGALEVKPERRIGFQ